jgi:hypothetical protein
LSSKDRVSGSRAKLRARFEMTPQHGSTRRIVGVCQGTALCHQRFSGPAEEPKNPK